jgi:lysozyme family protein
LGADPQVNFDRAFRVVVGHEGGYVNDPRDPGGETKFGISKRAHPSEDIAGMTLERAKAIYLRDYWGPVGCDAMPDEVKLHLFDLAVNSGMTAAITMLQAACGESQDGIIGPLTLQAAQSLPPLRLVARLNGQRLEHLAGLPTWPAFGRGWVKRIASNLIRS